jgi:hypothetical protein
MNPTQIEYADMDRIHRAGPCFGRSRFFKRQAISYTTPSPEEGVCSITCMMSLSYNPKKTGFDCRESEPVSLFTELQHRVPNDPQLKYNKYLKDPDQLLSIQLP